MTKFRHELKYVCTPAQAAVLEHRIKAIMTKDPHTGPSGFYQIRSLYFDDAADSCYYENENGTDPREKFRIRIYNGSDKRISLELKRKEKGMTQKLSCPLTKEQYDLLSQGLSLPPSMSYPPVLQKLLLLMEKRQMQPKVIVSYKRIPYIYRTGNVRVTFDSQLISAPTKESLFKEHLNGRPVMPNNLLLMEVKFDELLPNFIKSALSTGELRQISYSKYYLCRKYPLIR